VRREWRQQPGQVAADPFPGLVPSPAPLDVILHQVGQFHQGGHGGIEAERVHVMRDLLDGLVQLSRQRFPGHPGAGGRGGVILLPHRQAPDAIQEPRDAIDPAIVPFGIELGRPDEQFIDPGSVGAVPRHHVVGGDAIPF